MAVTQIVTNESTGNIPTVGVKELYTTGNTYFVDSNNGADTNNGLTSDQSLATVGAAITLATANAGDVILVRPNHAETITASVAISKAGISILGIGNGNKRPIITSGTGTGAGWTISADSVRISNVIFKNNIDSQVEMIDIADAEYTQIDNCEFLEGASSQYLIGISITNAGADHCKILNNTFIAKTAGPDSAIKIGEAVDDLEIAYNRIFGDFSEAAIHNPTGKTATNLDIHHNYIQNDQTGDWAIELVSACTGAIRHNDLFADALATILDPGSCYCVGNKCVIAIDTADTAIPLGGAAADFIGRNNANNNADTSTVVLNGDGSVLERMELLQSATPVLVTKATAALPQSTDGTLFTVSGGQVELLALVGEVTTVIHSQATLCKLKFNPTGTGADVNLCADLDWNADAVGTLYSITGNPNDIMQDGLWVVTAGLSQPIILGPGVIELECDANSTGSVGWQLIYRRLEIAGAVA